MSFDLGNWAEKLSCEMCGGAPPIDLNVPPDYFEDDGGLPDDFWDEPPEPPEPFDPFDLIPDPHPTFEFPDGGIIIGIEGSF